ncbi:MAG: hypothetical protein WBB48_10555 [Thermodesulfobacteriota bacterium]
MRYFFIFVLMFLLSSSYIKPTNALECLPSCSSVDGRFLTIAGTGLSSIVDQEIVVNLVSTGENLEFSVFDGEAGENWDLAPNVGSRFHIMYELYADPVGDASGLAGPAIAKWTGDGSGGRNVGSPMANNDWSDFSFRNMPQALSVNGDYVYSMRIVPIDADIPGMAENVFKIRTPGMIYVPAMFPVSFITPFGGQEDLAFFSEDLNIIYPNGEIDVEANMVCGSMTELCDQNDPSCCLFETTYDGVWSFFMNVPGGETGLDVWDGDFDYGDFAGTVFDTDDPNTPGDPFLPPWSIGTDVVFQTARPAIPNDNNGDSSTFIPVRDPSIQYFVIDPLGNSYQNFNPSGDREWELFRLDTTTDNPAIAEYQVDSIEPGMWEVRVVGVDMSNLNSILLPFDLRGEIVEEPPPAEVPTLSEWGLITLALMGLLVSIFYLRNRKKMAAGKG